MAPFGMAIYLVFLKILAIIFYTKLSKSRGMNISFNGYENDEQFKAHHMKCANCLRIKCFFFKLKAAEHVDVPEFKKSWQSHPCFVNLYCYCFLLLVLLSLNHVISMTFFILRRVELKCLTLKPCVIFPKNVPLCDDASNGLR